MLTVEDLKGLNGKKVLVRVDFNVPHKGADISDDNPAISAVAGMIFDLFRNMDMGSISLADDQ